MFGLRKRLSGVKPPASVVEELSDSPVIHDSEEQLGEVKIPQGPRDSYEYSGFENMTQSFSSISDGDASQSSEETGEEEAVPLAVKSGMDSAGPVGGELNFERVDSPEELGNVNIQDAQEEGVTRPPLRVHRQTSRGTTSSFRSRREPTSTTTWLGLDISIIIALVSPIGNLLTGGDHVKNLLLLLLLIYYLHQLVEGTLCHFPLPFLYATFAETRSI